MTAPRLAASEHKRPPEESSRIFAGKIEPILLGTVAARQQTAPRLIMLGGQPGSGKTSRLRFPAEGELAQEGGFVAIDADQLRTYHPHWDDLNREDDSNAALATHPDAAEWVNRAIDTAIRERCHVVLDGTMGSPESVKGRVEKFENAGYAVEVRILAVDAPRSWLGVLRRYEEARARLGSGRMTPREVHDQAHDGLVETLRAIESGWPAVRVRLYSRDGAELFDSVNPVAQGNTTAAQALQVERGRKWTPAEDAAFRDEVRELEEFAIRRGADATTIERYRNL